MLSASQRKAVVALAALAGVLLTARLGVWQLDRAAQKTALQAAIDERGSLPALDGFAPLAATTQAAAAQHHRKLRIAGRWSAAHTVYLDNRQMNGRTGFFVVTPLLLGDGSALLVQRGWQARNFQQRELLREVPTPDGLVELEGRIAPPPARLYEFDGGQAGRIRQNLDLDAFARESGLTLRPMSLLLESSRASRPSTAAEGDGLERNWPAPAVGVSRNHGYAAQWFALAALIFCLYVWFQLIQPRRRARH